MQVNQENIQRPALFSEFFSEALIWNNEYLTYIITTVSKVVTSTTNNIKNTLNNKNSSNATHEHVLNVIDRIKSLENESLDDFRNKYESMILSEQDRRIRLA